jgi:hypothetical protein
LARPVAATGHTVVSLTGGRVLAWSRTPMPYLPQGGRDWIR